MKYYLFEELDTGAKYLFETYEEVKDFTSKYISRFDFSITLGEDYKITEMKIITPQEALKDFFRE